MTQTNKPKYGPCSKKQAMFLNSTADIVVFGGAAKTCSDLVALNLVNSVKPKSKDMATPS